MLFGPVFRETEDDVSFAGLDLQCDTDSMDFTRATALTPDIERAIEDAFEYHKWDDAKVAAGNRVRTALAEAVKVIVANAPPSPDRSSAIRLIRQARMEANSAITHAGKY
jgi:hypothetical protein